MLLTDLWEVFDYFAEEPPVHILMNYIAQWCGYKPAKSGKQASSRAEAGKLNRAVDLRSLGPMKNLLQMPSHVQEATRATLARMRETKDVG